MTKLFIHCLVVWSDYLKYTLSCNSKDTLISTVNTVTIYPQHAQCPQVPGPLLLSFAHQVYSVLQLWQFLVHILLKPQWHFQHLIPMKI